MRHARRAVLAAAAVVALVALLAVRPISSSRAIAAWTLVVAALVLLDVARGARSTHRPGRFEAALRRMPPAPQSPLELTRVERQLELGAADAEYGHRRLLPILRAAAAARLASRHGVDLRRRPERARALLGDETWELLRPDRPAPADRHGPGIPMRRIEAAIVRLESL